MARLAVPWQQIPAAAAALDPSVFRSSDDVQAVLQCLPTDDEAQMLGSYLRSGGQLDSMSDAEAFCWQLAQVSGFFFHCRRVLGAVYCSWEALEEDGGLVGFVTASTIISYFALPVGVWTLQRVSFALL